MKKLITLILLLAILVVANFIFNDESSKIKKDMQTLAEAIGLSGQVISIEINNNGENLKMVDKSFVGYPKSNSCFGIEKINLYCADEKKINLFNKFLNNYIKDIYENTEENINRLGFNDKNNKISIIIKTDNNKSNRKTLFFGNINNFSEVYVLQSNKIYKVNFLDGIFNIDTKFWIDKSKPIISLLESDEFDIKISKGSSDKFSSCELLKHKDLVMKPENSILRNSFIDLYASDVITLQESKIRSEAEFLLTLRILSSNKKAYIRMWRRDYLVYMAFANNSQDVFVIPSSVYDNVNSYCEK